MLGGNYGKVFLFIQEFMQTYRYPPTYQEIANGCGIGQTTALKCVEVLEKRGYLARDEGRQRTIRILKVG